MDIFSEDGLVARFAPSIVVLASLASLAAFVWKVIWGSGLLSKMKRKIAGREESWREWVWNIDDDERNQVTTQPC